MLEIAGQVREARLALGLTQHELAKRAGVSRPSVARVEAGEDVSTATLSKITGALGLELRVTNEAGSEKSPQSNRSSVRRVWTAGDQLKDAARRSDDQT